MRTYSQLSVQIPEPVFDLFLARVCDLVASRWRRDHSSEESSNDIVKLLGVRYIFFNRTEGPSAETCFLYQNETFSLCNVITTGHGISYAAHAKITADMWNSGVKQACEEFGLKGVHTPSKNVDPSAALPPGVRQALKMFALGVNKSTGSSHPDDMALWCKFLALLHASRVEFDEHYLDAYLAEKKFPEEIINSLLKEYAVAMTLLPIYDRLRAERQPASVQ